MPTILTHHSRRSFLASSRGMLALPFLDSAAKVTATAANQNHPIKRMIFLGGGYGFTNSYRGKGEDIFPSQAGRLSQRKLSRRLAVLKPHLEDICIVSNLTNHGVNNPHGGSYGYLNCGTYREHEHGISCDQLAAKTLGKTNRFTSLIMTADEPIPGQGAGHGGGYSLSHDARGRPMPGISTPLKMYQTLFAQPGDSSEKTLARLGRRKSILDLVEVDGSNLKQQLAKEDAAKLDEYFNTVREIENGLVREEAWAKIPKQQAPFEAPPSSMTGEKEIKLMLDMLILALQSDMTRVATYRLPVCSLISSLEIKLSPHSLSHYGFSPERTAASQKRDQKILELYGWFIQRLKETKDRDGSRLYDSCIVNYGTNLRSGHGLQSCPTLLTGGGIKIKRGQHIVLPEEDTSLANYWLTLLQQAGVQTPAFHYSTGTVSEVLV